MHYYLFMTLFILCLNFYFCVSLIKSYLASGSTSILLTLLFYHTFIINFNAMKTFASFQQNLVKCGSLILFYSFIFGLNFFPALPTFNSYQCSTKALVKINHDVKKVQF